MTAHRQYARNSELWAQDVFSRPLPEAVVYDLSVPHKARITLQPTSTWSSGPHWHEAHTEYLKVESGAACILLGNELLPAVKPSDGVVTVPRGTIHEWRRSDTDCLDTDLVVSEWTNPEDGQKEIFFRDLNGSVLDHARWDDMHGRDAKSRTWTVLQRGLELELRVLFLKMDNYPVLIAHSWPMLVHRIITFAALYWAAFCAGFFIGSKAHSRASPGPHLEYVPERLLEDDIPRSSASDWRRRRKLQSA